MRMGVIRNQRRRLALLAGIAVTLVGLTWQGATHDAAAIATPSVFTVVQSPAGPATVNPGDDITYTINFTAGGDTAFLYLDGNLGPSLHVTSFVGGPWAERLWRNGHLVVFVQYWAAREWQSDHPDHGPCRGPERRGCHSYRPRQLSVHRPKRQRGRHAPRQRRRWSVDGRQ